MRVKLKTLSPLHIGSGQEASPLDYFIDGTDFCRLDMSGLFADPGFLPLRDKFIQAAGAQRYIGGELPRDLLKRHVAYRIPTAGKAQRQLSATTTTGKTVVKLALKSAGRVFLPGSSVKGTVLSALCWKVLSDGWNSGNPEARNDIRDLLSRGRTQDRDELLDVVLTRLGGRGERKFTHWLDVTDSDLKRPDDCLEISLAQVQGSRRTQIPILYETLKTGTEFTLELKPDPTSKLTVEAMLATVSEFYRLVNHADGSGRKETNLIRLGQGSGAFAVSLLILTQQIHERYDVWPPRTRKRVDDVFALGWAQLTTSP